MCLEDVIGVRYVSDVTAFARVLDPFDGIDVHVGLRAPDFKAGGLGVIAAHGSNSFAAPIVTAIAADLASEGFCGRKAVMRELLCRSDGSRIKLGLDFYGRLFSGFEPVSVPIVSVPGGCDVRLLGLHKLFLEDGYRAVCLTEDACAKDVGSLIFCIDQLAESLDDAVLLICNSAQPDIVFVNAARDRIAASGLEVGLTLTECGEIGLWMDVSSVFQGIVERLS